jgi:hypothetical protein
VHPALAVDAEDGSVLGLAAATIWRRTKVKDPDYQELPIEEKESHRWIVTPIAAREALKEAALVTTVSDRESDIYEMFARVPDERTHVLARAHHDRKLGKVSKSLFKTIAAQPVAGFIEFDLVGRPGRLARKVALTVRFCEVTLRQPRVGADPRDPRQLNLTVVEVREENPPAGEEPILWRLLTTHKVASLEDARRIVDWYRLRWTIEQWFRSLKSQGIALEESLIADGEALERLASGGLGRRLHGHATGQRARRGRSVAQGLAVVQPGRNQDHQSPHRQTPRQDRKAKEPPSARQPRLGRLVHRPPGRLERLRQRTAARPDHLLPRTPALPRHRRRIRTRNPQKTLMKNAMCADASPLRGKVSLRSNDG